MEIGGAALCAAWAPDGERFAVGLASKDTAVCHYEPQVTAWVASKVGKSKAAITALAWHQSSQYLATGSTDRHLRVYDVTVTEEGHGPGFNALQVTEDASAWVNAIAFSRSNVLAFACQDATVRFKSLAGGPDAAVEVVRWKSLPFLDLAFVGRNEAPTASPLMKLGDSEALPRTSEHTNTITGCRALSDGRFSTSSLDGTVLVWELSA
ncbi:ARPC1B [Symbiodinium natans]|uniref:Arp2/3 complex 41 kDa subunit n=1 Tax=Symbiodinium natans TaxID=878477 RepID=A0A812HUJ9_9DINO|nr:ARPC1B [Symbiodinium natans]